MNDLFWIVIQIVLATVLIAVFVGSLYSIREDMKHQFAPSGVEANVTVLGNNGGECVFEYNGERLMTSTRTGLLTSPYCPYLTGEEITVYQTNGGWWRVKYDNSENQ